MSSEDQVRPYHAKDEARGQEAAEAVAAVLKHAAEKDQAAQARPTPKRQPRWMLPVGLNLAAFALFLLIAQPPWVVVNPVEGPDLAHQEASMMTALWFQAQAIDTYRQNNGQLPASLADVGKRYDGIEYVRRGGDVYQLIATVGDTPIVWDSSSQNAEIVAAAGRRISGG